MPVPHDARADHALNDAGSQWHRWEPHIHTPGTVLNDQFGRHHDEYPGADAWDKYLRLLEGATPAIRAIGVTDYYVTQCYAEVCKAKASGRLPNCQLIFPNIEMRYDKGTIDGRWVNVHLLVSPEDPDHLEELERFLSRLTLEARGDTFACTTQELIRLGKKVDSTVADDRAALARGCDQVKVKFDELRHEYGKSDWARENIIVATAGGGADGTSAMDRSAGATLREELERFSHAIFASSPQQREFWRGQGAASVEQLRERLGGPKPCLSGSDAHKLADVARPDEQRYCWVKGVPAFDSLKQARIDPDRAFVGEQPPSGAHPSQTIRSIALKDADWAQTPELALNPGLVAVIGARGSGKTALADVVALGCDAARPELGDSSFLNRAKPLLGQAEVTLEWEEGESVSRRLDLSDPEASTDFPRARYLSQKFVEHLCSAQGLTDSLVQEIERVIFDAHSTSETDGTHTFDELLTLRAARPRAARERGARSLSDLSERIGTELDKVRTIPQLKGQIAAKTKVIEGYQRDRAKLVLKGKEDRLKRLNELHQATEHARGRLRALATRRQSLLMLRDEVKGYRELSAPETLRQLKESHSPAGFGEEEWQAFLLDYCGDVDGQITANLEATDCAIRKSKGSAPQADQDAEVPLIAQDADLTDQPMALLEAEVARMQKLVSMDQTTASRFAAVSKQLAEEAAARDRLNVQLEDANGATARAQELRQQRDDAYVRVFEALVEEEQVLQALYQPLQERLASGGETLRRLSLVVAREVDVAAWATAGEDLLDLRREGPFKGRGTLEEKAAATLGEAWTSGSADAVGAAMAEFLNRYTEPLLTHAPVPKTQQTDYRAWAKRFAQWLYSTAHITMSYSINYDGVDIRNLSPGTRGIVLVLLYLALDDSDYRPLIIDQPEENLDPESIHQELVGLFQKVKNRRQIILITHNANLVVNADADQIIVASAGPHSNGGLPPISYASGGLEREDIRSAVCRILEGGEEALKERARRLRVPLDR